MTKAEKTRETIIEKVSVVFNKQGYYGTSLSDLIKVTGLSKGSIYGNFKDKEEVAIEAFKYNINKLKDSFRSQISMYTNSVDKLLAYTEVYHRDIDEHIERGGCPLLNTMVEADDTGGELKVMAVRIIKDWKKRIVSLVEEGLENDEIKPGTDPDVIADLMISIFEGASILTKNTKDKSFINNGLKHIHSMLLSIKKI